MQMKEILKAEMQLDNEAFETFAAYMLAEQIQNWRPNALNRYSTHGMLPYRAETHAHT